MGDSLDEARNLFERSTTAPDAVDLDAGADLLDANNNTARNVVLKAFAAVADERPDRVTPMAETVIEALADPFPVARDTAVNVVMLAAQHDAEAFRPAIPALIERLNDEVPQYRFRAAGALAILEDEHPGAFVDHSEELFDFLVDGPRVQSEVSSPPPGPQAARPTGQLADREYMIRREQHLERTHSQSAAEVVASILVDVASIAPEAAERHLSDIIALTTDDTATVRAAALEMTACVAEHDPSAAQPATEVVLDRLDDDVALVRLWAVEALEVVGATEAVDRLRDVAETDTDDEVAERAAETADTIEEAT